MRFYCDAFWLFFALHARWFNQLNYLTWTGWFHYKDLLPHRSQNRGLCLIKCSRKLRLLNLSQFLCWFWISNQFLNICSGLQLRPPRIFIGFLRRKTPFKIQSTDFDSYNSRTISDTLGGARGYPGTQIWHIWDFMTNLKRFDLIFWKKILLVWFWWKSPNWLLWYIMNFKNRQFVNI